MKKNEEIEKWDIPSTNTFKVAHPIVRTKAIPFLVKFHEKLVTPKLAIELKLKVKSNRRKEVPKLFDVLFLIAKKYTNYSLTIGQINLYYAAFEKQKTNNTSITKLIANCYFLLKFNEKKPNNLSYSKLQFTSEIEIEEFINKITEDEDDGIINSTWKVVSIRKVEKEGRKTFAIVENYLKFIDKENIQFQGINRNYSGHWHYIPNSSIIQVFLRERKRNNHQPIERVITLMCYDERNTIIEGAMNTATSSKRIFQNKILLKKNKVFNAESQEAKIIPFYSNKYESEEYALIRKYFSNNFNSKYSHSIGNIYDEQTLKENVLKEISYDFPTKYSFYFATSVQSLSKEQYNFTQEIVIKLINYLTKISISRKPCLNSIGVTSELEVRPKEKLEHIKNNTIRQEQCIDAIKLSDHIVWVNLFESVSISEMQASWLFYPKKNTKPSIFIKASNIKTPSLMTNDEYLVQNNIRMVNINEDDLLLLNDDTLDKVYDSIQLQLVNIANFLNPEKDTEIQTVL